MSDKPSILVVEDSNIILIPYVKLLENLGIPVVGTCQSGKEAVKKYEECSPDIISLDLHLITNDNVDDIDGDEAAQQILEKFPKAKIIFATAAEDEQNLSFIMQLSLSFPDAGLTYLEKPIQKKSLLEAIEEVTGIE